METALGRVSGENPQSDGRYLFGGEVALANLDGRRAVGAAVAVDDRCGLLYGRNALPTDGLRALTTLLRGVGPIQFAAGFAVVADRDAPEIIGGRIGTRRLDRHTEIAGGLHTFGCFAHYSVRDPARTIDYISSGNEDYAQSFAALAEIFYDTVHLLHREVKLIAGGLRRIARGEELTAGEWVQFAGALELVIPRMTAAFRKSHVDVYRMPG